MTSKWMTFRRGRPLFYIAIAFSSLLLFSIQPIITKAILPAFGGTAGVWVTAMLFFQAVLLAGYLYSHLLTRWLSRKGQSTIHLGLLGVSLAFLPAKPHLERALTGTQNPVLSILSVLAISVGLPYFLLSSTSPLLQSWFVSSYKGAFPYRLFALSNAGSVVALLAYPILIEPLLPASVQLLAWSVGYAVLVVVAGLTAAVFWSGTAIDQTPEVTTSRTRPFLWIGLAACASALWMAVANHLSQEVAPVPFRHDELVSEIR